MVSNAPVRLTAKVRSQSSRGVASKSASPTTPALTMTISGGPVSANAASSEARLVTSTSRARPANSAGRGLAVEDGDVGAALGERPRHGEADAVGAAGDDRAHSRKIEPERHCNRSTTGRPGVR